MGTQHLRGCVLRLRQSQVLCELRRVCWPVAVRQHLHIGHRAAPFGILSYTHKVLCPPRDNSPRELGLDLPRLWPAVKFTFLIWLASQILPFAVMSLPWKPVEFNPLWGAGSWRFALSEWLGQLFGNCPFEEVLFRGFLLPQCLLLTKHWIPESRRWKHLAIALLLSQGYFALCHVFFNLHQPEGQWLLIAQFVFGLLFAAIYLSTGNLFVAIGIHALVNNPAPLLKDPLPGPGVTGSIVLIGCLIWLCVLPWRNKMQPNLLQSNDD